MISAIVGSDFLAGGEAAASLHGGLRQCTTATAKPGDCLQRRIDVDKTLRNRLVVKRQKHGVRALLRLFGKLVRDGRDFHVAPVEDETVASQAQIDGHDLVFRRAPALVSSISPYLAKVEDSMKNSSSRKMTSISDVIGNRAAPPFCRFKPHGPELPWRNGGRLSPPACATRLGKTHRIEDDGQRSFHQRAFARDAAFEPGQKQRGRHGDGKADGRRQQRDPDAAGEQRRIDGIARFLQFPEGFDHAEHRAEQADQRRDLGDRIERAETGLQPGQIGRRLGLQPFG